MLLLSCTVCTVKPGEEMEKGEKKNKSRREN
jgi:hypothetical protein